MVLNDERDEGTPEYHLETIRTTLRRGIEKQPQVFTLSDDRWSVWEPTPGKFDHIHQTTAWNPDMAA
jgi:hypothetical protein